MTFRFQWNFTALPPNAITPRKKDPYRIRMNKALKKRDNGCYTPLQPKGVQKANFQGPSLNFREWTDKKVEELKKKMVVGGFMEGNNPMCVLDLLVRCLEQVKIILPNDGLMVICNHLPLRE